MNIGFASVAEVDQLWPLIVKRVQHSCIRGGNPITAGELWQMCRSGNGFLCIVHDRNEILSSSVWRFEDDAFRCWMLEGKEMRNWLGLLREFIEKIASENGSKRLLTKGRKGWLRLFKTARECGDDYEVILT